MRKSAFVASCVLALVAFSAMARGSGTHGGGGCKIDQIYLPKPFYVIAKVYRVASPEEVRRKTAAAEKLSGAKISPAYKSLPRIIGVYDRDGLPQNTIAAIVDGNVPRIGDVVELELRHPDPHSPCHFIPVTVVPSGPRDGDLKGRRGRNDLKTTGPL
jgi:hypothetical protein